MARVNRALPKKEQEAVRVLVVRGRPFDPGTGKKPPPCNLEYSRLSAGAADPESATVIQSEIVIFDSCPFLRR